MGSNTFYILKSFKVEVRYQRVIVVKLWCNEGVNKALSSFQCKLLMNHTNIVKMEESPFINRCHVKDHTERLIKYTCNTHVTLSEEQDTVSSHIVIDDRGGRGPFSIFG